MRRWSWLSFVYFRKGGVHHVEKPHPRTQRRGEQLTPHAPEENRAGNCLCTFPPSFVRLPGWDCCTGLHNHVLGSNPTRGEAHPPSCCATVLDIQLQQVVENGPRALKPLTPYWPAASALADFQDLGQRKHSPGCGLIDLPCLSQ